METADLKYKIGIGLIPKIGPVLTKRLIAYTGSIEAIFHEKKRVLAKIPGIGEKLTQYLINQEVLERAETEIEYISRNNIKALFYLDKEYPERLKNCEDAPVILFIKGEVDLNNDKVVSIVGTRNATAYGREKCNQLVTDLAERKHNPLIISGLAYGIDICAHKASLRNGLKTAAVLGHGLTFIYPAMHRAISHEIVEHGALISDFVSDQKPEPGNFIKRNRIIAGLADATIVVESGERGGALITADIANSYNRDVFAFPGRIGDKYSTGCNKLIKTNKAALIESVNDLEYIMGWQMNELKKTAQKQLFVQLSPDEEKIVKNLQEKGDLSIDQLCVSCEMPVSKVSALLLNLEFSGVVQCLPGKLYRYLK
jgi:DNA processing protein